MNASSKVLLFGASGMLGRHIAQHLKEQDACELVPLSSKDVDIADEGAVAQIMDREQPDIVIHAAAYTKVEQAESDIEECYRVNVKGTQNIVHGVKKQNSILCFFSTDYVFDGGKVEPYHEDDSTGPLSVYGRSKLEAEQSIQDQIERFFIFRTSWLYGPYKENFVSRVLDRARRGDPLKVVHDQIGSPTYTGDIAANLWEILQTEHFGCYHLTNEGQCSWYDFAKEAISLAGLPHDIMAVPTKALSLKCQRPAYSKMSTDKVNGLVGKSVMPFWKDSLKIYIKMY